MEPTPFERFWSSKRGIPSLDRAPDWALSRNEMTPEDVEWIKSHKKAVQMIFDAGIIYGRR